MKKLATGFRIALFALVFVAVGVFVFVLSQREQQAQGSPALSARYRDYAEADDVTRDIRDASRELVRVDVQNPADRQTAERLGRVVNDFGSFVVISKQRGVDVESAGLQATAIPTSISLPAATFDPAINTPAGSVRPEAAQSGTEKGYYIVQLGGIANDGWLDSLRDAGLEILQYVPHNAFFVYADAAAMSRAVAHSRVRWTGAYLPQYKISPVVTDQVNAARTGARPGKGASPLEMTRSNMSVFDVAVWDRASLQDVAARIADGFGGSVKTVIDLPNNYFNVVRVELPLDRAAQVAEIADVVTVDPYARPTAEDERAAHIVAGNYTDGVTIAGPGYDPLAQFGADGTGVTVSVVDDGVSIPGEGGLYLTSNNVINGPLRGAPSGALGGHGHLNASIIAGTTPHGALDPTGHNYGIGIAPGSNVINIPYLKGEYTGNEANAFDDSIMTTGPNGVRASISNNSWGSLANNNIYDSYTAQFDGFVRDASFAPNIDPLSLIFSAGNMGPSSLSLTRPKAAKNLIAVGNSENLRPELAFSANNMEDLHFQSSLGPAADGRVKPDIIAPGTVITGSRPATCTGATTCFDSQHGWSTGTSHSAPQVAGAAAVFTHWWKKGHGGANPSPAMIKAAVIGSAQDMNGTSTTDPVPNRFEGWGRINMKFMLNTGVPMKHLDQTATFNSPGEIFTYNGVVGNSNRPVRVTLVWTDPPGAANANPALVNNLDLTVTIGGTVYRGNVFNAGLSTPNGSPDAINNVENVFLPAGIPAGTSFSIQITSVAINGDGILGNADPTDQHFALIANNFAETAARRAAFDMDGDSKSDFGVFRPSNGTWYVLKSTTGTAEQFQFGQNGDVPVDADFDGDLKADYGVWRPVTGEWFWRFSSNGTFGGAQWGANGDRVVAADYDADGKTDFAVWRPSDGLNYIVKSSGGFLGVQWGTNGDVPANADLNGDGKTDFAVFRPSTGFWYTLLNGTSTSEILHFGTSGDIPARGDIDGDQKDDIIVWRPSTGGWFYRRSASGTFGGVVWGSSIDRPVPGDYDGDGRTDFGIWRSTDGIHYIVKNSGGFLGVQWGGAGDIPVLGSLLP